MKPRTAFDLDFPTWPPVTPAVRHGITAPLGAIRFVTEKRKMDGSDRTVRMIKVRMDGPPCRRWMNAARFWWIKNKGVVPAGYRVCHADGDTLNDAPTNYELRTPGDVIACWHLDNPKLSERQHRRCGRARADYNRDRAALARLHTWPPKRWFPVDLERRAIIDLPKRMRWQIFAAFGSPVSERNWRHANNIALGWPGMLLLEACILAALAVDRQPRCRDLVRCDTTTMRDRWGFPVTDFSASAFSGALSRLIATGLVARRRFANSAPFFRITRKGLRTRIKPCPVIAVRGEDLAQERFAGFDRLTLRKGIAA